jgi:hypothetical protein
MLWGCPKNLDLGPGYQVMSKRFLEAIRWQDYQGAAVFMQEEHRKTLVETFEAYEEDLHIVEAEYVFSRLDQEKATAVSEIELKYYLLPSTQVKKWRWKFEWILIPADSKQAG